MNNTTRPLRIGILSDNPHRGLAIMAALERIKDVRILLFIANNERLGTIGWLKTFIWWLFRDPTLEVSRLKMFRLIFAGRLRLLTKPINDRRSLELLRRGRHDIGVHDSSVIYDTDIISCFKEGILNAHFGWLPDFRGRSVFEWSLLNNQPVAVSVFFIDAGIDTGEKILLRAMVGVPTGDSIADAKSKLFARAPEFYATAISRFQKSSVPLLRQSRTEGRRYYVMSRLFTEALDQDVFH